VSDPSPFRRPYRAAALFHAGLAVVIVIVAAITSGDLLKAALVACGYFVVATAWSWFRFRQRERSTGGRGKG
jgi:hypothetical protein